MTFLVTKTYGHEQGLSACFRQWRATHSHCRFIHGYALSFMLVFTCETLDHRNWVMDFGGLKAVKQMLKDTFDHKLVVAEDDPYLDELTCLGGLGLADPLVLPSVGCEAFAHYVFHWVDNWMREATANDHIMNGARIASVEVREHAGNSAIYVRELK